MKLKRTMIASLLAVVGFGGAALAYDRWIDAPQGEMRWHRGGRHVSGFERWCADGRERRFDDLVDYAEGHLRLTAEQAAPWVRLVASLRDGAVSLAACRDVDSSGGPAPSRELARAETMMAAGLVALRRIRPDVEPFYATLTAAQRSAFNELMGRPSL